MSDGPTPEMVAKALRDRKNSVDPKKKPMEMQSRGYQLHVQEAKSMGDTPMSYEAWLKQNPGI